MKKFMTKIVAVASAIAMMGTMAMAADCTAFLMYADANWQHDNWSAASNGVDTTVSGAGDYTVSLPVSEIETDSATDADANGAVVFCVDIVGFAAEIGAESEDKIDEELEDADKIAALKALVNDAGYEVKNVVVSVDGDEFYAFDDADVIYGDIESNGNLRIEIYNAYGLNAEDETLLAEIASAEALTATSEISVSFTLAEVEVEVEEDAEETATEDAAATATATATPAANASAKTGDSTAMIALSALAVISLAGVVVLKKRNA